MHEEVCWQFFFDMMLAGEADELQHLLSRCLKACRCYSVNTISMMFIADWNFASSLRGFELQLYPLKQHCVYYILLKNTLVSCHLNCLEIELFWRPLILPFVTTEMF